MRLSIPLSVESNPLPDTYTLLFRNISVADVNVNATTIEFINVLRNQSGEYSLRISNNISGITINFTLNVTCKFQTTLGLDNIAILSRLCNIRVCNINIANISTLSIISHTQQLRISHISQADCINKYSYHQMLVKLNF